MHKLAKKIAECLKANVEGMGIDNIHGKDLCELGQWADIIKDLAEYDQAMRIIEAMDEEEDEERRYYRGQPRNARTGRYERRGYTEMMRPEQLGNMEYSRDMDRHSMGRMYYPESSSQNMIDHEHMRDVREGRSGQMRKGYMESKEMHKANTPEDKKEKMKELEKYMMELSTDVTEMINDATPEEKNLLKAKLQTLITKVQ